MPANQSKQSEKCAAKKGVFKVAMVKLTFVNTPSESSSSQQIGVLAAISIGFERIAARPILILPPILLDLLLWLGVRMRISSIVEDALKFFSWQTALDPTLEEQLALFEEMVTEAGNAFNLFSALSSIPIGIPSHMAGRMPLEGPFPVMALFELSEPAQALLIWLALTGMGIVLGTLYHVWIARQVAPNLAWNGFPVAALRMLAFSIVVFLVIMLVFLVVMIVSSIATLILPLLGAIALFLGFTFVFWTGVYLVFTPLGIVRYSLGVFRSMTESLKVVRWNFLSTVGFLLIVIGISWLGNLIWSLPDDNSWFSLLAIIGHGFVTAVLLTASYAFYQGRRDWTVTVRDSFGFVPEQSQDPNDVAT